MVERNSRQPAWKKNRSRPNEHKVGPLEVEVINNDIEKAIKILDKKVGKDGVLSELKRRRFAEKPSEKRRRKRREAIKKARRAMSKRRHRPFNRKKTNANNSNAKREQQNSGTNTQKPQNRN